MTFAEITLPSGLTYNQPTGIFIGNEFIASKSKELVATRNPANDTPIVDIYWANDEDVDLAVESAKQGFKVWSRFSGSARRDCFLKLATLCQEHADILAEIESLDTGKPIQTNAKFDIEELIEVIKFFAGFADKLYGKSISPRPEKLCYTLHQPLGVVGCIIPFNFPLGMMSWKLTSIACGNCAIFKPHEETPLSILYFAQLVKQAGFPPGVFNVLPGSGALVGNALVEHPGVAKIAFTGSTSIGQTIQRKAASTLKPLTLECGGKSPLVVFNDANFDQAVKWAAFGIFSNMGQICCGTSRIYVEHNLYNEFLDQLKHHVREFYPQGDPSHPDIVIGPQISKKQQAKVNELIQSGITEGARVILGHQQDHCKRFGKGYYVEPTILADVTPEMRVAKEEIFGPVVVVTPFHTYDEAILLCNDSKYGLGAAVFTDDIRKAHKFAAEVESGMVWINSSNDVEVSMPFGGTKMSGYGRELSEYAITHFTTVKTVHVNLGYEL